MITHAQLQSGLDTHSKWVEQAIVVLYKRQTNEEQHAEATRVLNGRGFAACDARSGTYMAKWILSGKNLNGKWLDKARKMAKKYSRQLLEASEEKERQQRGYKSDVIVETANRLGIPLAKLTVLECKPKDICGIPNSM